MLKTIKIMWKKIYRSIITVFIITICVISCQNVFEDDYDIIQSTAKYDVIYISNDNEYKKMYSEYSSIHYSTPYEISKFINEIKSKENINCGILKFNNNYKITIKSDYNLTARLFFYELEEKYMYYDTYDLTIKYPEIDIENYGFSLHSNSEYYYNFEIQTYLIFKSSFDGVMTYVKVPLNIKGKFDLKTNYLECEMDV